MLRAPRRRRSGQVHREQRGGERQQNHRADRQERRHGAAQGGEGVDVPVTHRGQGDGGEPERCRNAFKAGARQAALFAAIRFDQIKQRGGDHHQE